MLELSDEDFKAATMKMLQLAYANMLKIQHINTCDKAKKPEALNAYIPEKTKSLKSKT